MDKKEALLSAINEQQGLIGKVASMYTNTVEDRNDLVQEIIYQLWKSVDSFDQRSALNTWMYRVAMNVAIYHLKVSKRKVRTVPLDTSLLNAGHIIDYEAEEKWMEFKQHINKLNLLDKGIVLLYLENKSYEEIGQVIGISASNVGTKLSRIREKLKQQISKKQ